MLSVLPVDILHEVVACLPMDDVEALSRTCSHLRTSLTTLHPEDDFSRPLSVMRLDRRRYCDMFVVALRRGRSHLAFHPSAMAHIQGWSAQTTRMLVQCLVMAHEKDAATVVCKRKKLSPTLVLNASRTHFICYRNVHWSLLLYSVVRHTLQQSSSIRYLHISNLPLLVHKGWLLMSSANVFLATFLAAAGPLLRALIVRGVHIEMPQTDTWTPEALITARESMQEFIACPDGWQTCRFLSQRRFSSATMSIGTSLYIAKPLLLDLDIQQYCFNETLPSGNDVLALAHYLRSDCPTLTRLALKNVHFVHGDDILTLARVLPHLKALRTVEWVGLESTLPPSHDPHTHLFALAQTQLHTLIFDYVKQWSTFPLPLTSLLPSPSVSPHLRKLRIRRMYLDPLTLLPLLQHLHRLEELVELDLSYNTLDGHSYEALGTYLLEPKVKVRRLFLAGNLLSYIKVDYLAEALRRNTTLLKLDLADNFLCLQGFLALQTSLQHNTTLRNVRVDKNSIRISLQDLRTRLHQTMTPKHALTKLSMKDNSVLRDDSTLRTVVVGEAPRLRVLF